MTSNQRWNNDVYVNDEGYKFKQQWIDVIYLDKFNAKFPNFRNFNQPWNETTSRIWPFVKKKKKIDFKLRGKWFLTLKKDQLKHDFIDAFSVLE